MTGHVPKPWLIEFLPSGSLVGGGHCILLAHTVEILHKWEGDNILEYKEIVC